MSSSQACHKRSVAIDVVADATSTTKGCRTKPEGEQFPRGIVPWNGFALEQEQIWE